MQATAKVTPFAVPAQAIPRTEPITQLELSALLSLRGRLEQLSEQVEAEEQSVKARLEAGAPVEPGDHTARVEEHWRKSVAWKDVVIRLADRLGLDGEAYCANVLGNTKPTRTVSLFVA